MTTFFGGPGFGGAQPASSEQKALSAIDSRTQPFVNKDFVRNIQWLNASVDTLSMYTQRLQDGVDAANQNAFEQIQGFIADLIVIFAGGSPTGIDLGDLKYVIQGIGALLGINPETVFPLNLVEAVGNLFDQFIVPLPQFTDIIFDSFALWLEEFGFTDEAIAAVAEFNDAVIDFAATIEGIADQMLPALNNFLRNLGLGSGWFDVELWRSILQKLQSRINELLEKPRQLLLSLLSYFIVTIFEVLTWLVRMINPRNLMSLMGLQTIGPQLAPDTSSYTTIWQVGSNPNTQWVYDSSQSPPGLSDGNFYTYGNAYGKRILTQGIEKCEPGDSYTLTCWLKWDSVPVGQNQFGPCIAFYSGLNEMEQMQVDAPSDRSTEGGWEQVGRNVIVPNNCDGFKIGYRCAASVSGGTVRGGGLSCAQMKIEFPTLSTLFKSWVPWDIFKDIPSLNDLTIGGVREWLKGLLNQFSPINAINLFGLIPPNLVGGVSISSLLTRQPNLLAQPGFDAPGNVQGQGIFHWDETTGHDSLGCVYVDCDGTYKEEWNVNIIPCEEGQKYTFSIWTKWSNLGGYQSNPVFIGVNECSDERGEVTVNTVQLDAGGHLAPNSNWVRLETAWYTVPHGVSSLKFHKGVRATATGGRVWFDEAIGQRTNLIRFDMIEELEDMWNSLMSAISGIPLYIEGIFNRIPTLDDIISRLQHLTPNLSNIVGGIGNTLAGLFDASWLTNIFNIPPLSDLSIPGVLNIVDNIVTKLFGWTGAGYSHEESADALESVRFQMISSQQSIQDLYMREWSVSGAQGVHTTDDFNRNAQTLGSDWWISGNLNWSAGKIIVGYATNSTGDGMDPIYAGEFSTAWPRDATANSNSKESICVYQGINDETQTDYQDVLVICSAAQFNDGQNDVLARVGADGSRVRFRASGDRSWELHYYINGNASLALSGPAGSLPHKATAGTAIRLLAGDKETSNPRLYRGYLGGNLIFEWPDPGLSIIGSGNRRAGFGGRHHYTPGNPLLGIFYPAKHHTPAPIDLWQMKDQ